MKGLVRQVIVHCIPCSDCCKMVDFGSNVRYCISTYSNALRFPVEEKNRMMPDSTLGFF